jgi:hypothetical protein
MIGDATLNTEMEIISNLIETLTPLSPLQQQRILEYIARYLNEKIQKENTGHKL